MKIKINVDTERPPTLTFPAFTSTEDVLTVHTSVSLLFFFSMYINKNTFIQVILEQFFFFLFFLYTKKLQKLQKAPLNRPAVTPAAG